MLSRASQAFSKRPRGYSGASRRGLQCSQVGVEGSKEGSVMSRTLFIVIVATVLFRWARTWRRIVGVTLIATVMAGMVFPPTAYAQFGLLGSIQNIVNIINGAIRSALNLIRAVSQSLQALYQEIVWPVRKIDRARDAIASFIEQFRDVMQSIYAAPVSSAT